MKKPINIVLIEDDATIREGYTYLFNAGGEFSVTRSYPDAEKALQGLPGDAADVILLDIQLPGLNGIDAITRIRTILPEVPIIMLTVYDNEENVFRALLKGASGYLTKGDSTEKILDAIRDVVNGGAPMSRNIAKMVIHSFHRNPHTPLTRRETEILEQVAAGKSRSKIAKDMFIDLETVKSHIKHIYAKLNVHSREEAIRQARDNKYI